MLLTAGGLPAPRRPSRSRFAQATRQGGNDRHGLIPEPAERNLAELLFKAETDNPVHGGEHRPRPLRQFGSSEIRPDDAQRLLDQLKDAVLLGDVQWRDRLTVMRAMLEQGTPARALLRSELEIGQRKADQPAKVRVFGAHASRRPTANRLAKFALWVNVFAGRSLWDGFSAPTRTPTGLPNTVVFPRDNERRLGQMLLFQDVCGR